MSKTISNALSLVQTQGEMEAKGKYYYEPLDLEVSLIGFVPVFQNDPFGVYATGVEMNAELLVTPYRVRAKSCDITVPVLQKVAVVKNKQYLVRRSLYTKIAHSLFKDYYQLMEEQEMFRMTDDRHQEKPHASKATEPPFGVDNMSNPFGESHNDHNDFEQLQKAKEEMDLRIRQQKSENTRKAIRRHYNISTIKELSKELSINEEGMLVYNSGENAYELTRTHGDYTCVFDGFLCLCTFLNKVTGLPSYAMFSPERIVCQDKKKDGN